MYCPHLPKAAYGLHFCLHGTLGRENLPSYHATSFCRPQITQLCFTTKCTRGSCCRAQNVVRASSSEDRQTWVRILFCHLKAGWPWASYLTSLCLGFHHYSNGINSAHLVRLFGCLKEITHSKRWTQCQQFSKYAVNVGYCQTMHSAEGWPHLYFHFQTEFHSKAILFFPQNKTVSLSRNNKHQR